VAATSFLTPMVIRSPARGIAYVDLGTMVVLRSDELASGLGIGAPPLKEPWRLLPPRFLNHVTVSGTGLVALWLSQHVVVVALDAHTCWWLVRVDVGHGVPVTCRPSFGDQHRARSACSRLPVASRVRTTVANRGASNFNLGVHVGATNSVADDNSFITGNSGLTGAPGPSYDDSSRGATGGDALGAAGGGSTDAAGAAT
jgi:hypothetical protein